MSVPPYRLGMCLVASAIVVASGFTIVAVPRAPATAPAGQDLGDGAYSLGTFRLTERSGRVVTEADLADEVWIASFLFTRCPTVCPKLAETLARLQAGPLKGRPVRFVSVSVDPEHDTPAVLSAYAKARDADPERWWFLTGDKAAIYDLILTRFHLPVAENPEFDPKSDAMAVAHSDRLALVDRGNKVVGIFASDDPDAVNALVARTKRCAALARPGVESLPALNASLNAVCSILLVAGLIAIRSGHHYWRIHAAMMGLAVVVSAVFLTSYLAYHLYFEAGATAFKGVGSVRFAYFTILISHTMLATFGVVPLVGLTLARVFRREWARHARIARVTFPIWLYVSVTGVVIYLMLYRLDLPSTIPLP